MNAERLQCILNTLSTVRVAVLGDFFLDKYMVTDPAVAETSLETGLEARQVVEIRVSPGAAGTVANNLVALGVGAVSAIGFTGDDGQGYELRRELGALGIQTTHLQCLTDRFTPTYTKPMTRTLDGEVEMERLDIKNRHATPAAAEDALLRAVDAEVSAGAQAVIVADQVQERNCGVVTDRVREGLVALAARHPDLVIVADSRVRIGEFRSVITKPNLSEAMGVLGESDHSLANAQRIGRALAERNSRPAFVTAGPDGMVVCEMSHTTHVPGVQVRGPIDIVGAGDSATAGIVCALSTGASSVEAAQVGNLCASVTIRKLGTTGTARPDEMLAALAALPDGEYTAW